MKSILSDEDKVPEAGKKFVAEFNDSAAIAFLPPLRDAVYYMKRLNMLHH